MLCQAHLYYSYVNISVIVMPVIPAVLVIWSHLLQLHWDDYVGYQGFMQDKIIASHTSFGGHMDVNC